MTTSVSKAPRRTPPSEYALEFKPSARLDVIDVRGRLLDVTDGEFGHHGRAVYCSHHTTAGFLEQGLSARLGHDPEGVDRFMRAFQNLFPPDADYRHDQLHLRTELSPEEREVEPLNADSHLTFIGSGLSSCVTYTNRTDAPVFLIDLDGVHDRGSRTRRTTVIGFDREREVTRFALDVPVSRHTIDSVNLTDPRLGIFERIEEEVRASGVRHGRVRVSLDARERYAGLTVNEYETLLMRHDLPEVLANPMRFVAEQGLHMLADPLAIPGKTRDYAKYDMVRVFNELLDVLGITETRLETLLARIVTRPASRFLRMKNGVNLLVAPGGDDGDVRIVAGRYQSPILVQWRPARGQARRLSVAVRAFD